MSGTAPTEGSIVDLVKQIDAKNHKVSRITWAASELGIERCNLVLSDAEYMGRIACLSEIATDISEEVEDLLDALLRRVKRIDEEISGGRR